MKDSKIEWTDHTFNPWIGCTKVSPGCANCYAETLDRNRFSKTMDGGTKEAPVSHWGRGAPRHRTSAALWKEPLAWNKEAETEYLRLAHQTGAGEVIKFNRPRVFCASLADWLDDEVPVEWLAELIALIHATPMLDWLLLTKRPENWRIRLTAVMEWVHHTKQPADKWWVTMGRIAAWINHHRTPENVWLGTSVEDQKRADERIPALLRLPARVRFLSMEPLLGAVRLGGALYSDYDKAARQDQLLVPPGGFNNAKVNWVIVGGESGPGARPMHPEWARDLRDECEEAGTHFLFKQWGEHTAETIQGTEPDLRLLAPNQSVGWGDGKTNHTRYTRVGKKEAGRLLDGREWNEIPNGGTK